MIESKSRKEFEEIMQEKSVITGLNELDRLIREAKARRDGGEEAPAQAYDGMLRVRKVGLKKMLMSVLGCMQFHHSSCIWRIWRHI